MDFEFHVGAMVRRRIEAVELRRTQENGYEFDIGPFSYDLHFDDGVWFLDQYRRRVERDFIGSFQFESLADGVNFAFEEKSDAPVDATLDPL